MCITFHLSVLMILFKYIIWLTDMGFLLTVSGWHKSRVFTFPVEKEAGKIRFVHSCGNVAWFYSLQYVAVHTACLTDGLSD